FANLHVWSAAAPLFCIVLNNEKSLLARVRWRRPLCEASGSVIAGLDPAIHPLRKTSCEERWTPGSSPGVTRARPRDLRACFRLLFTGRGGAADAPALPCPPQRQPSLLRRAALYMSAYVSPNRGKHVGRALWRTPMARPPHDYDDIPGTFVFDAERSRQGYGIN